jgi:hypothetical protein
MYTRPGVRSVAARLTLHGLLGPRLGDHHPGVSLPREHDVASRLLHRVAHHLRVALQALEGELDRHDVGHAERLERLDDAAPVRRCAPEAVDEDDGHGCAGECVDEEERDRARVKVK